MPFEIEKAVAGRLLYLENGPNFAIKFQGLGWRYEAVQGTSQIVEVFLKRRAA
jgi:hypothetical protein